MSDEEKKPILPRAPKQEPESQSDSGSEDSVAEIYWTDQTTDSLELTDSSSMDSADIARLVAEGVEIVSDEIIAHQSQDLANLNIRGSR